MSVLKSPRRQYRKLAKLFLAGCLATTGITSITAAQDQTLLLREPAISKDKLAFVYAGDIWTADRDGDNAKRLTTHPASETTPEFSPDGKWIAFTANYDGNADVYIMSVDGGQPKRLTWHPGVDTVNGWTPDGKSVVFASRREVKSGRSNQLYHVSVDGGFPEKQMEALVYEGVWSGDGKRLAYRPTRQAYFGASGWRQYRGGATPPIWIYDPETGNTEKIPHDRVNDTNPMWVGDDVYFISDREDGAMNLFKYDTGDKELTQLTDETQWDVRSAGSHGRDIIYETGGHLMEMNTRNGRSKEIKVSINPDLPQLRPQWKSGMRALESGRLSPTGKRALITARGEIFTVPIGDGTTRNITGTDGVRESSAIWSPKGGEIAYITDEDRGHKLVIVDQTGGEARTLSLGDPSSYYTLREWTPDAKRIVYSDNHLNLFAITLEDGNITKIATNKRRTGTEISVSPDSNWVAYTTARDSFLGDVMLYSFETGEATAITDGMAHAGSPAFSKDGKYLYFTASTNSGPSQTVFLDMSTQERPLRRGIYAVVLSADGKSPLLPKAGDEKDKSEKPKDEEKDCSGGEADAEADDKAADKTDKKDKKKSSIDLAGITDRIIALPVAERSYDTLRVASDGALFYIERIQPGISREVPNANGFNDPAVHALYRFDPKSKRSKRVFDRITQYEISADGKNLIVAAAGRRIMTAKASSSVRGKRLNTADVRVHIDPRNEWVQIFNDVWRMEKEFFYDPNLHGLDWQAVYDRYRPLVDHVGRREDLNTLMIEMIGEMQVGHNRIFGGDGHSERPVRVGLLGADLRVEDGKYRIKDIYTGEKWNPFLEAPLAAPGIGAKVGDYILSVNGNPVDGSDNFYAFFENTIGKQVTLNVASSADGADARDIVVEPVRSENQLRNWRWIEDNRKYVEEKSGGRVGYVYVPNTAGAGFTFFNRMFFAQAEKDAMIIDERSNGGGQAANYITDVLSRKYLAGWKDRDAALFDTPGAAVYGPKVMLIDQDAGSGGDFLPYSFRHLGIGKLIGTRTWGGLIGISTNPPLIDGGFVSVPYFRFFDTEGKWEIENIGVAPDIEVELLPADVNKGTDAQLDRALEEVLNDLKTSDPVRLKEAPAIPTELGK